MSNEITKAYEPLEVEKKWYARWEEKGYFQACADSGQPAYCIVMPPPNVTGKLHMGHALNITLQDIVIRWQRMKGLNILWVPGTDHAGIATQNVVERHLAEKGIRRTDLGRERFEQTVWEWKETAESNILKQIRKLGCSCDWSRRRFTLDEGLSRAVREVFVRLYEEGLIYRGEYLVNWCPRCSTAISDLEVNYQPTQGKLWYLKYHLKGSDEFVVVATTRPETMLGDTAVAVHPEDERYRHLWGYTVILPLMNREIPLVSDHFVEKEFGTGVVKVTPGHDPSDFEASRRHQLPVIKVIGDDATMTDQAGDYAGLNRFEARQKVVADLQKQGLLLKVEEHSHNIGHCQRCDEVIEPLVSTQWFVKVKPLAEVAIRAVEQKRTVFVPDSYQRIYFEWMHNIHDWCISRQLWWGHRIPAWHCRDCGEMIVSRESPTGCPRCQDGSLEQESDVLDTWFSSALWPFSTLGWPDESRDLKVYYPTNTLITGFDIIFFWVARMLMMGLHFFDDVPFRTVYINGLVRDERGQKMSKSRGNIIDPLEMIDRYGTDAIRFTLAVMAVPGTDIPFSVGRMAGYRAFCNKIWNAGRFLLPHVQDRSAVSDLDIQLIWQNGQLELEDRWILSRLLQTIENSGGNLEKFRFHEASNELYHFFWHEFCDWYIELIKPDITGQDKVKRERAAKLATYVLETSLRLLHPFIPFITEELWQKLPHQGESVMLASYPEAHLHCIDKAAIEQMESLQDLITAIRTARTENNIDPQKKVPAQLLCANRAREFLQAQKHHLKQLAQLNSIEFVSAWRGEGMRVRGVAHLADFSLLVDEVIDVNVEHGRLTKQMNRLRHDVEGLEKKVQNADFVQKAPAKIVESTRQRYDEALSQLRKLQEKLDELLGS